MQSTSSVVTLKRDGDVKPEFSYRETFGIFVVEFLLPGSIYCYGGFYVDLWRSYDVRVEDGLWFPVIAFSSWMLTNCWSLKLCQYLKTRRYEKAAIFAIACLIVVGNTLFLYLNNHAGRFALQGLIQGTCTSILLALIKISSEYYQNHTAKFVLLTQITRASSFLFYPLIFELLGKEYGAFGVDLIHCAMLMNILPASLVVTCNFVEPEPEIVLNSISESLFYKANNLQKDEIVSDSSPSYHSESNEASAEEYETRQKNYTYNGIELLSVIEEETESRMTYSELPTLNKTMHSLDKISVDSGCEFDWQVAIGVLVVYATKLVIVFVYVLSLTLLPFYMRENFVVQLVAIAWFINTVGLSCVSTPMITKTILFIFGLFWSACSFFYLSPFTIDVANRISLIFAFGFATLFHSESICEQTLFREPPKVLKYINGIIGVSITLIYTLIYELIPEIERNTLFLIFFCTFFTLFIIWIVIMIVKKFVCKCR